MEMKSWKLVVVGNPKLSAEVNITVQNLSHKVDGKWKVISAYHQFETTGYTTKITLNRSK